MLSSVFFNQTKVKLLQASPLQAHIRTFINRAKPIQSAQFYIRGIPREIEPHRIKELFSRKCPIYFINVPKDGNGSHLGFCFATISTDMVDWFIKTVHGMKVNTNTLTVEPANGRVKIPIGRRNPG